MGGRDGCARKVLLIEDSPLFAAALERDLAVAGYLVESCATAAEARGRFAELDFDIVLLDWLLPDGDGVDLLVELRDRGYRRPVLMLTALDETASKVKALNAGCNDYMAKPVDIERSDRQDGGPHPEHWAHLQRLYRSPLGRSARLWPAP